MFGHDNLFYCISHYFTIQNFIYALAQSKQYTVFQLSYAQSN